MARSSYYKMETPNQIKCTQNVWQRTSKNDDDLNPKLDG